MGGVEYQGSTQGDPEPSHPDDHHHEQPAAEAAPPFPLVIRKIPSHQADVERDSGRKHQNDQGRSQRHDTPQPRGFAEEVRQEPGASPEKAAAGQAGKRGIERNNGFQGTVRVFLGVFAIFIGWQVRMGL